MLTIKHIEPSGHETVQEIKRVTLEPDIMVPSGPPPGPGKLFVEDSTGLLNVWAEGRFYIMNDQGRTVAKYDLGPFDAPRSAEVRAGVA